MRGRYGDGPDSAGKARWCRSRGCRSPVAMTIPMRPRWRREGRRRHSGSSLGLSAYPCCTSAARAAMRQRRQKLRIPWTPRLPKRRAAPFSEAAALVPGLSAGTETRAVLSAIDHGSACVRVPKAYSAPPYLIRHRGRRHALGSAAATPAQACVCSSMCVRGGTVSASCDSARAWY